MVLNLNYEALSIFIALSESFAYSIKSFSSVSDGV